MSRMPPDHTHKALLRAIQSVLCGVRCDLLNGLCHGQVLHEGRPGPPPLPPLPPQAGYRVPPPAIKLCWLHAVGSAEPIASLTHGYVAAFACARNSRLYRNSAECREQPFRPVFQIARIANCSAIDGPGPTGFDQRVYGARPSSSSGTSIFQRRRNGKRSALKAQSQQAKIPLHLPLDAFFAYVFFECVDLFESGRCVRSSVEQEGTDA
jgi:hypothetical protein